jgi:transcriptional regulator with XRE-family HTH domain
MTKPQRREELSAFLKQHRDRIAPETVGLTLGARRRTPGLRREEVAQLAGVGVTWYTWLEQGRDIRVSAQVLDSIARVLQLSSAERTYLFALVRNEPAPSVAEFTAPISPALQLVLDNQRFCPAYILGWKWDILAWNQLASLVVVDFESLPVSERNILWLLYMNDQFRARQPNLEMVCRETLAHFRASCSPYITRSEFTDWIDLLTGASPEFKEHWNHLDVLEKRNSLKEFDHPVLGRLYFEMVMMMTDLPGTKLVLFVPIPGSLTQQKLCPSEIIERSSTSYPVVQAQQN